MIFAPKHFDKTLHCRFAALNVFFFKTEQKDIRNLILYSFMFKRLIDLWL